MAWVRKLPRICYSERITGKPEVIGCLVGTGRFELPTPRTPSECSTRLSHVPTGRNQPQFQSGGRVDSRILHQLQRFLCFGAGFSSNTANWIFFSTGSIRS